MISYNNSAPNAVNNVGQFGATEGSIGAYKSAAEYAADSKYWAMLCRKDYNSIDEILKEVERLYAEGSLLKDDIEQLKSDFVSQESILLGLIQSTETAIDNTNSATALSKEATRQVLDQLDIISNMTVQVSLLPPGSLATGSYDNTTGVFSFGLPEGQPGRDGTDGTISDIGSVAIGVPVSDDYGFYVDKEDGGLYRTSMVDIANLVPSIRSLSINGGEEQTGAVSFNSVSSFNSRVGDVLAQTGDYSVDQIVGAASSGINSDITSLTGLTTAITVEQGGTGSTTASGARNSLGLGSVSTESIVPISKGGTGVTSQSDLWTVIRPLGATPLSSDPVLEGDAATKHYVDNSAALTTSNIKSELLLPNGASMVGTAEGVTVQDSLTNLTDTLSQQETSITTIGDKLNSLDGEDVSTTHRGTLAKDLNAIDRRPDGYGYDITAILATGPDVQLNEVISVAGPVLLDSNQRISGVGGNLKQNTSTAAGVRVEGSSASATKDYVTIDNLRSTGSASSMEPGNESYAVFLRNTKYNRISGVLADKYTGGVAAGTSKSLIVRDVIAHDTTFHPLNPSTRDGRGGYGVITDNIKDSIINGVILDVGAVDDGRHVLYVSTGGYGNASGNRNFIASNLIGKYLGKDDRNFMGVNVRKSNIFQISNINIDGANSGVAFNRENGDITDFIASNLQLDIIKYADGIGVYGITMPKGMEYVGSRYLISNFNIRVRPKDESITGADCVGISTSYQNGLVTNGVINVPPAGSPILINDGADNTTISNIHDNILPDYSGETAPMISFTGSAVSNITVRGITTKRPMFARLNVVTDLTVDFDRKARIATDGSGGSTKIDENEIISRVALGAASLTVVFPSHVTQNAVDNARFEAVGQHQVFINNIGAKQVTLSLFTPSGSLVNPQSTAVTFNVILSS